MANWPTNPYEEITAPDGGWSVSNTTAESVILDILTVHKHQEKFS